MEQSEHHSYLVIVNCLAPASPASICGISCPSGRYMPKPSPISTSRCTPCTYCTAMYAVFFFPLIITRSPHILATIQQQSNASCSPATLSLRKLASSAYHSSGALCRVCRLSYFGQMSILCTFCVPSVASPSVVICCVPPRSHTLVRFLC